MAYNNSVVSITNTPTPDPFMVFVHGEYFLTFTSGDHVEIWSAPSLAGFSDRNLARVHQVWRPPSNTPYSADLWAPELHSVSGRWYIYVACADPSRGNPSHRMYVLGGPPSTSSPISSAPDSWSFLGPLQGLPTDQWAIDGTIVPLNNTLYFAYSGWPYGDFSDRCQALFLTRLTSPTETSAASPQNPDPAAKPVMISRPDHPWEFSDGDHGVNEGPQFLASPARDWCGIVYSCAGSWTRDYKMAVLHYVAGMDPLAPNAWRKDPQPLIQSGGDHTGGPYGPGHGSFLDLSNEVGVGGVVGIFHATDGPADGWNNRRARCQRVWFGGETGGPWMGGGVGVHVSSFQQFVGVPGQGQQVMQGGVGGGGRYPGQQGQQQGGHHHGGFRGLMHKAGERFREL